MVELDCDPALAAPSEASTVAPPLVNEYCGAAEVAEGGGGGDEQQMVGFICDLARANEALLQKCCIPKVMVGDLLDERVHVMFRDPSHIPRSDVQFAGDPLDSERIIPKSSVK